MVVLYQGPEPAHRRLRGVRHRPEGEPPQRPPGHRGGRAGHGAGRISDGGGAGKMGNYKKVFIFFPHPGCSAFGVHHPTWALSGWGGGGGGHFCDLEAGHGGVWAPNFGGAAAGSEPQTSCMRVRSRSHCATGSAPIITVFLFDLFYCFNVLLSRACGGSRRRSSGPATSALLSNRSGCNEN